jgi:hypothetical protein
MIKTILFGVAFVLLFIDVFAKYIGVDFPTGTEVVREHAIVTLILLIVCFLAHGTQINTIHMFPIGFVLYLHCWLPAIYYYFGDIGILEDGLVQIGVGLTIMVFGHWLIYRLKLSASC